MSSWSSENATTAYLQALKMGKRGKEPDVGEFISALAAGNNAQLIVMACSSIAVSRTLALVAAARQTGGRVVCILSGVIGDIDASKKSVGRYANCIEFVKGDAQKLLMGDYKGADFVLIDCNNDIDGHENVFRAAKESVMHGSGAGVIVGYNALPKGSWGGIQDPFFTHWRGAAGHSNW